MKTTINNKKLNLGLASSAYYAYRKGTSVSNVLTGNKLQPSATINFHKVLTCCLLYTVYRTATVLSPYKHT